RKNRADLKELGTRLIAKPLGRPSAVQIHVRPGERNPIEGKFGQAKTGYGLDRIKARLKETSESWIASIILVLNLVKLAGAALPCHIISLAKSFSASAWNLFLTGFAYRELIHCSSYVKIYEANRVKYKIAA
ncbi:transposase, partial [Arthrospira platensis SPKY1]|nr:transposase [Arthrospira platensis SPKY1]